jgi:peptide chain release factor 1
MIDQKLAAVAAQYDELQAELARPETSTDPDALRRLGKELARLEPIVSAYRDLEGIRAGLAGARQMRDQESEAELRELARDEVEALTEQEEAIVERLRLLLLPRDPNDERDVIVEIRAGAGGNEAGLFAAELFRMYEHYAEKHRWSVEVLTANETGIGGLKEVIFSVHGRGAYSKLKFEGGVHRVQRVPTTESAGRIHTSTATVAVLPEAEEVEVDIDEKDLRIDVYRSTGPGGQSVNTTDSAVRITHMPTGIVVAIQDEKSQHKNRARAMQVLRARLLDLERRKAHEAEAEVRRSMVGTGERSEKIRTYNFPQDRLTDHRLGRDFHGLPTILDGELDPIIEALVTTDQAVRLAAAVEPATAVAGARGDKQAREAKEVGSPR